MLRRKFAKSVEAFLREKPHKTLLVNGARQIGKSYIIRYVGSRMFKNFIEINLLTDKEGKGLFANVKSTEDLYIQLGILYGNKLDTRENTLIFLDEIQVYPHLLTMLKFLNADAKYTYIASGSQLGIALSQTLSVPIGSIKVEQMYPLDFEEFLWAMGASADATENIIKTLHKGQIPEESTHEYLTQAFRYYMLVGGMPEAVNVFLENRNITHVRRVQSNILELYKIDASQYDREKKLKIRSVFDAIPSALENIKKRLVFRKIENRKDRQFEDYADEFEYLTASGVAIEVKAVSNPKFPLKESEKKNLLKLYLNDVGLLTSALFEKNANAILNDEKSVNLGSVYEAVVAQELHAHGFPLYYYDNKKNGEVDFLIDDFSQLTILPVEVKSGKDYTVHSALDKLLGNIEYNVKRGLVLGGKKPQGKAASEGRGNIDYLPAYAVMALNKDSGADQILPKLTLP